MLRPTHLRLPEMALLILLVLALVFVLGPLAGAGLGGIVLVQILAFAAPPLLIAHRITGSAAGTISLLGLHRPKLRAVLGATLTGLTFWYVSLWLIMPISIELFGTEDLAELEEVFMRSDLPLAVVVLAVGLAPAICEEILYRGALTRSLQRFGNAIAIIIPALLFALMHIQPVRMLPVAVLGLVLGAATVRSGGIVPAMWVHFLNNTVALLLSGGALPGLVRAIEMHTVAIGIGALALCVIGVWLLWTTTPEPQIQAAKGGSATSP